MVIITDWKTKKAAEKRKILNISAARSIDLLNLLKGMRLLLYNHCNDKDGNPERDLYSRDPLSNNGLGDNVPGVETRHNRQGERLRHVLESWIWTTSMSGKQEVIDIAYVDVARNQRRRIFGGIHVGWTF